MKSSVVSRQLSVADVWEVHPATEADYHGIWAMFQDAVSGGDVFSYDENTSFDLAMDVWVRHKAEGYDGAHGYVVRDGERVIGSYSLRHNHYGRGSHVANAIYMVHRDYRGRGIARAMCAHSLAQAKREGCISMQFNYVVSTNTASVNLWKSMGFEVIGVSPKSYRHKQHGLVDIYIMHRFLDGGDDA